MAHPILMPKAGQSMTEGTIVSWFKKEGDSVARGEPLLEIETDKANLDVESSEAGVVRKIFHVAGDVVPVLAVVAVVGSAEEPIDFDALRAGHGSPAAQTPKAVTPKALPPQRESATTTPPARAPAPSAPRTVTPAESIATPAEPVARVAPATIAPAARPRATNGAAGTVRRIAASPLARRVASERGVDLATVEGTGPRGRILRRDVESAPAALVATPRTIATPGATPYPPPTARPPESVPLAGMRGAIARALQQSKSTIPHFYSTIAIDMSTALGVKAAFASSGVRVTVNDLVLSATAIALSDEPKANCRVFETHVEYPEDVNIGVAVGTEDGLLVPVVLRAQTLGLAALADASRTVIAAAQNGKLIGSGKGTFTISNLGMWGIESFTAIINPPEGAILAVGGIQEELVPAGGGFFPRSTMRVTLSCDHRAIDGLIAARFLARLKHLLESGRVDAKARR